MHASKQRCKIKEQLRYIGRYIRRPVIGINRIETYDDQFVTFKYKDKTETVSVEDFISRLIRHYGIYSCRSKGIKSIYNYLLKPKHELRKKVKYFIKLMMNVS